MAWRTARRFSMWTAKILFPRLRRARRCRNLHSRRGSRRRVPFRCALAGGAEGGHNRPESPAALVAAVAIKQAKDQEAAVAGGR